MFKSLVYIVERVYVHDWKGRRKEEQYMGYASEPFSATLIIAEIGPRAVSPLHFFKREGG